MNEVILVINSGSSSIKFCVYEVEGTELKSFLSGQLEGLFTAPTFTAKNGSKNVISKKAWGEGVKLGHEGGIDYLRTFLREHRGDVKLVGVGHRVGHGGTKYFQPVRVDRNILAELEQLTPLAPLHQPSNLKPISLLLQNMPDVPQVACFDTGFHHTNPKLSQLFGIPKELTDAGVCRYGFHGLSYEYIASVLSTRAPRAASGKTVVLHLGSGSSMCAMEGGKSITSTMGFSPLDGLIMGTRCGSLDPGVLIWLMDQKKMDARAIEKLLYTQCGLLGVSGISSDVRTLLQSDKPRAKLALDLFVYRITRQLGSLAAALGGLDAIVFTAGVGENSAIIRERVCRDAAWLGVELDTANNERGGPCITTSNSRVSGWVIPTNEELMIARHTQKLIGIA